MFDRKAMINRLAKAQHAMQSGVATLMNYDPGSTQEKHLRVGINTALVDSAALGQLLIKKGLITDEKYVTAITEGMEAEVQRYKDDLKKYLPGVNIELH